MIPVSQQPSQVTNYAGSVIAASLAIAPVFRDLMIKSAQQIGNPSPNISWTAILHNGRKAIPTKGFIVGGQMAIQSRIEKDCTGIAQGENIAAKLLSSAITGILSSPVIAIFNGQTMGWSVRESLQKFSLRQGGVIALQETAFVGGLSLVEPLTGAMENTFGKNKVTEYAAAFLGAGMGSLIGHPANTTLTRWQNNLPVEPGAQLLYGAFRRARAIGVFSMIYKFCKESISPGTKQSH